MKSEGNSNAAGTETAVNKLVAGTLDKIIEGAKTANEAIGIAGDDLLGNVADQATAGTAAEEALVKFLSEGIGKIVNVALKDIGNADSGTDKKLEMGMVAQKVIIMAQQRLLEQ
ncbi:variable large family protein (plasmid) [Borrelia nietonii YOR]|nr:MULTISPECIES: variable large family protein [Borrelia]UPA10103.1 variable large family protein [Borrelia nietonii YOR]